MDIKNSNGLVGKYNDRDVYVTTRKEYDSFDNISNSMYYILKDHPTIEGHPMLLFRGRIKGYCKNDGGIKIYDRDVYYTRASANEDKREYKYTMSQLNKKEVAKEAKKEVPVEDQLLVLLDETDKMFKSILKEVDNLVSF